MPEASRRLTLCVIARDEERLLPGCLESVREVVDALVVVDTGSQDRTVELARAAGATVVHHRWDEDFAAARNTGLAAIDAGWVLVLDADERLAPGAGPALRAAIASDRLDAGLLAVHEADTLEALPEDVVAGRARRGEPWLRPRLLRRTPDLAFEGSVAEDLRTWLRGDRRIQPLEAAVAHYGGVPELAATRDRAGLRLHLLQRRCEREPEDGHVRTALANELLRTGDQARGREEAEHAWRLVEAASPAWPAGSDAVLAATLHAFQSLARGDLDAAAEVLARCAEWGLAHPNLDLLAGALLECLALGTDAAGEQAEALAAARAAYERCLAQQGVLFASRPLPGATTWAARTRLATVDLLCGRPDQALQHYDGALLENPALLEARLGRLEALLDLGMAPETLQGLEPWLPGGTPDAWTLAAAAAAALGGAQDAALFAERARDASATLPWASPHRRLRLEALEAVAV